ncbi:MAG: hypothetical protein U0893_18175 [Chloroflexota bacterium]
MDPEKVASHVRERSGLDVQAVTLVRSGAHHEPVPWVWAAMTEHGHFWAVEDGERVELFRAVARRTSPDDLLSCHSAIEAARRFLRLHPRATAPKSVATEAEIALDDLPVPGDRAAASTGDGSDACQVCGASFARRRQRRQAASTRVLCPRCRHAERERLRYQQDPRYRARRLAYSAARYRQSQQTSHGGG